MYEKKPMFAGGTPNFNEANGQYSQKPAMNKPAMNKPPMNKPAMSKPQARMEAMKKRLGG